jgi:isocitrate dehydrogenase
MSQKHQIAVAYGDGIGPEIMTAVINILESAGVNAEFHPVLVGEKAYLAGHTNGIDPAAWDIIRKCKVLLKAPLTTPQGGGFKSANVTIRKSLGLYANVRPSVDYSALFGGPKNLDVVIVRENEEDLYAGIEHRQTEDAYQCLKLITRSGSERINHFAFEYAKQYNRKRVTCLTKDNIMKFTDGLFHKVFRETAERYPDIAADHLIVDIGTARLATRTNTFDVIVVPNLYGDIISDVVAEVVGSIGLAPSANIGDGYAMFEAVHGSAPDIAGKGIANPSALLLSAVMMLVHIGETEKAALVHNAWLSTLERGFATGDLHYRYLPEVTKALTSSSTQDFANEVIKNLGNVPQLFTPKCYKSATPIASYVAPEKPRSEKTFVGIDVFIEAPATTAPETIAEEVRKALSFDKTDMWELKMITNRGVKVWPDGFPETFKSDHWRLRMVPVGYVHGMNNEPSYIMRVLYNLCIYDVIKTENLYTFDGEKGYSEAQGA